MSRFPLNLTFFVVYILTTKPLGRLNLSHRGFVYALSLSCVPLLLPPPEREENTKILNSYFSN